MRTDTTTLTVPEWLAEASTDGFDTAIRINVKWWEKTLTRAGLEREMPPVVDGRLRRSDIFRLAEGGIGSEETARSVLWASLAWGEGPRAFRNPGRVRSFLEDTARHSSVLAEALILSGSDPEAAYARMYGQTKNLGPAFFTKAMYFAGGGKIGHPSLVLDARVAYALRNFCGWESLHTGGGWPVDTYGRYCALLARWADELSTDDTPIGPAHLEYRLFTRR
ncbi:hypothetical protein HQ314_06250 [Rhodococcus sp. BP-332]|jgi:hypothetical protein|uniref:8-oxoguanine DNA glycosylase OGG fold protein n=1 Tax=Rhodococcus sp. BP-332 TaxID=2739447 RepID=UPI001C9A6AFC|nr:hypothetical protein [Rhodococcus sp. BP-332]MBY6676511.1 hypothetical protein [Rhodococcus sp. BP-332]